MTETDSQPIAENEQVKELLALLKDNNTPGYEEFAKLIEHVTGMEQRLLEATEELKAVRQEMQGLQNHSLKDALQKSCKAKQLRQMIHREGLFFTFGTLALSLTIGNGLGYLLVRIIINTQILTISQYEYPITQTLVLIVAVVIGQIAITVFVNRYIHKQSLVERMRD